MGNSICRMLIVAAIASSVVGCGSSGNSGDAGSQEEVVVKGTVKVKDKLLPGGTIHFNAIKASQPAVARDAEVQSDGTFTLKAYVGQNIVTISPPRKTRADAKNRDYFGLEYVEKSVQIKAGEENVMDFDMTP